MKVSKCCNKCWKWKVFKDDCDYFWELKKICSQYETEGEKKDKENALK